MGAGQLLIRSTRLLISAGTERMLVHFGKGPIPSTRHRGHRAWPDRPVDAPFPRPHGRRVLGTDLDPAKWALARRFGAETVDLSEGQDPLPIAAAFSRGRGVDGVLITASTKSNEPVDQAALM